MNADRTRAGSEHGTGESVFRVFFLNIIISTAYFGEDVARLGQSATHG